MKSHFCNIIAVLSKLVNYGDFIFYDPLWHSYEKLAQLVDKVVTNCSHEFLKPTTVRNQLRTKKVPNMKVSTYCFKYDGRLLVNNSVNE